MNYSYAQMNRLIITLKKLIVITIDLFSNLKTFVR